jgi:hypothetical protein
LQPDFPFISDDLLVASTFLPGGGADATTGSCGAYAAGILALGAGLAPRSRELSEKDREYINKIRPKLFEFRDWFIGEFSGVTCKEVQMKIYGRWFNLMLEGEVAKYYAYHTSQKVDCNLVTSKAAVKLAQILSRDNNP